MLRNDRRLLRHELSPWRKLSPATVYAGNVAYDMDITGDNLCGEHRHKLSPAT